MSVIIVKLLLLIVLIVLMVRRRASYNIELAIILIVLVVLYPYQVLDIAKATWEILYNSALLLIHGFK